MRRGFVARKLGFNDRWAVALDWVIFATFTVLVAWVLQAFVVSSFWIPSESMVPTLEVNDRILVNKTETSPGRGDIMVFHTPPMLAGAGPDDLVKRVVGLPGETIEGRDGAVYVNGQRLAEPYLPTPTTTAPFAPRTLGDDEYFMMGDNRGSSEDSRVFGPIARRDFVGEAFFRFWPISRVGGV